MRESEVEKEEELFQQDSHLQVQGLEDKHVRKTGTQSQDVVESNCLLLCRRMILTFILTSGKVML